MSTMLIRGPDEIDQARSRLFRNRVVWWARANGRRLPWRFSGQSVYRLVVTEVLLQRTKAETVAGIYDQFFRAYPNWSLLARASSHFLQGLLRGIGLWRRRSGRLIEFAERVYNMGGDLPKSREELERLPCVGQYVASAALLFQGVSNEPLLDAGMARVLERVFGPRLLADIRYDSYVQQLAREVVDCDDAVNVNWAILDLAALVCRKKAPNCQPCPVHELCRYGRRIVPIKAFSKTRDNASEVAVE